MTTIDLNADLGEGAPDDAALLEIVSSASIACGGHAGDPETMAVTARVALEHGVAIGAHPGYPDREGFGRVGGFLEGNPLYESLTVQVATFTDIAAQLGAGLQHVKPHGALYNDAVKNRALADVIARVFFSGHVLDPSLTYRIALDLPRIDGVSELRSVIVNSGEATETNKKWKSQI